ncbi:MAG: hypothetical protein EOO27_04805 [Comamonadaceae bacterium]|nr:MAG: hypothetical protein EOO27_04805 [Comamonadaceae bacterium]
MVAPSFFRLWAAKDTHNTRGEDAREFLAFLQAVRDHTGSRLHLDLGAARHIVAAAGLVLKAELSYLASRGVRLSGTPPRSSRALQVFTQTGFCDLLGMAPATHIDREDIVHWRHTSGVWTKTQPAHLLALLDPEAAPNSESLYQGVIETVANCIEHAYMQHSSRRPLADGQDGWWGFQQLRDGWLSTCICDLGIGVKAALPMTLAEEPDLLRKLLHVYRRTKGADTRALLAAVEMGRSRTKAPERGKGMKDAHQVIEDAGEGTFQFISGSAFYFYQRKPGSSSPVSGARRLKGSVGGTISFWTFPVKSKSTPESLHE